MARLKRDKTVLLVVDMQEGFRPMIGDFTAVAERIAIAVRGATALHVPCLVTEQYPKGLQHTAAEILAALAENAGRKLATVEKLAFSACGAADFVKDLEGLGARHVLVCGIEAHICVTQTTLDLMERGYDVHLLLDCITSRNADNKAAAVQRLTQAGAVPSTLEMALFELMGAAGTPEFKAVQKLIK